MVVKHGFIKVVPDYLHITLTFTPIIMIFLLEILCKKKLSLKLLGVRTFVKIVLKDFLLMINVCIVRIHYKCVSIPKENFNKICENDLPFFL